MIKTTKEMSIVDEITFSILVRRYNEDDLPTVVFTSRADEILKKYFTKDELEEQCMFLLRRIKPRPEVA